TSTTNPSALRTQASSAAPAATTSSASAATVGSASPAEVNPTAFDPNVGFPGLANTYANQFISSGFPINLLSYLAQNTQAQAFQGLGDIGKGLSEGESALGAAGADMASAIRAVGSVAQAPTGAMG